MKPDAHTLRAQPAEARARDEILPARGGEEPAGELLASTLHEVWGSVEEFRVVGDAAERRATRRICSDLRPSLLDHMGLGTRVLLRVPLADKATLCAS